MTDSPDVRDSEFTWGDSLPTLPSERLALRQLVDADVSALFAVFSDPDVMRYWDSGPLKSRGEARLLLEDIRDGFRTRRLFQWAVADAASDTAIGTCTIWRVDPLHRRAEIGFALARAHWSRGLATEAVGRLIQFAFDELDLHRLEADVDPRNDRSLRLLERLGFRREGYLRERYHVGGEVQDAIILGLLRSEWKRPDDASPRKHEDGK
jgi:RimJ/RimL family protein N-acetyltransferase